MEVHAHSHTARKKWTHYFWEFLMLFLAVFCGFLAEYQLEHKIEKDREIVYMKNMLADLRSDTATYNKYTAQTFPALDAIDSLMYLLKSPDRNKKASRIYYLARSFTMRSDLLFPSERTYTQMRSSGHLRLIHNQEIADSVSYYYNSLRQIENQNERITDRMNQYFLTVHKVFDAAIFLQISKDKKMPEGPSVQLLTNDPSAINELLTRVQYLYATFLFTQNLGTARYKTAESLIELIKKEYHLE